MGIRYRVCSHSVASSPGKPVSVQVSGIRYPGSPAPCALFPAPLTPLYALYALYTLYAILRHSPHVPDDIYIIIAQIFESGFFVEVYCFDVCLVDFQFNLKTFLLYES